MFLRFLLLACLVIAGSSSASAAESGPVFVIPLRTDVSNAQFYFLRRGLKEAERAGARALVIDMETDGGDVKATLEQMNALLKTKVPTVTYINDRAISAGALIALATQRIYMAPNAVIGAAAPVLSTGGDIPATMQDKVRSSMLALVRSACLQNGHNVDVAEAFVIKEREVKMGDVVVDRPDSLLTLNAQEAARVYNGKALLAAGVAPSLEDALRQAGLAGNVRRIEPTGFEQIASWLLPLAPLLLLGGLVCGWIEIKTLGWGISGIASVVCFTLFFMAHFAAGLSGWEAGALFACGLVLVLAELFLYPGTLVPGIAGAMMMVGSLIWAMIDRYPTEGLWPTSDMLARPLLNLGMALLSTVMIAALLARYLPRTRLYQQFVLSASTASEPPAALAASGTCLTIGQTGTARTDLRPCGRMLMGKRLVDVISPGEWVEAGTPVRVVSVEGMRVVVEAVG